MAIKNYEMLSPSSPTVHGIESNSNSIQDDTLLNMPLRKGNDTMTWGERWEDSKGMAMVMVSEMFGTAMAATARVLEMYDNGMTTLQIIFVRFSITFCISILYMYMNNIPGFPFGPKEVRGLLVLRGFSGFLAVFCFYYSLKYLPIAETLLLGFLIPIFTAYSCALFLHHPLDKRQLVAGLVSFFGVVLIARPDQLWFGSPDPNDTLPIVTPIQRLSAVLIVLVSDVGATIAYTTIRVVGERAHPLVSVNYYAFISTLLSALFLSVPQPFFEASFRLPRGVREWGLLLGLGFFGFGLQFLMTTGLVRDKSPRAVNMMYSSVVFGMGMDWLIWGIVPVWSTWAGGAVVIASTLWVAMQKANVRQVTKNSDVEYDVIPSEELRD